MTGLTRNDLKLNFHPGQHGLTCIDPIDSVLTENDGFDSMGSFFMEKGGLPEKNIFLNFKFFLFFGFL
jgi:hypothetical protein